MFRITNLHCNDSVMTLYQPGFHSDFVHKNQENHVHVDVYVRSGDIGTYCYSQLYSSKHGDMDVLFML